MKIYKIGRFVFGVLELVMGAVAYYMAPTGPMQYSAGLFFAGSVAIVFGVFDIRESMKE